MDIYVYLRKLPFKVVISILGLDVATFKTRKQGREYFGRCPIHQAQKNQTSFSFDDSTGKFFCFSCGAKGSGSLDLVMKVKGIGFKEACELLGAIPPQPAIVAPGAVSEATEPLKPFTSKYDKYAVPCEWLEKRIPDEAIRKRYGVFQYHNLARKSVFSQRVMIPIRDLSGVLYGYLGRDVSQGSPQDTVGMDAAKPPKYLFPPNFPKNRFLFGTHELGIFGQLPLRVVFLVESPFCVMKFAMYGLPAVSPFGWSVSPEQIDLLIKFARGVVYLPDRNKWVEASQQVPAIAHKLWVRMPELPPGCDDPEYLSLEQIQALTR